MKLKLTEQDRAFREEVRSFIAENLPDDIRQRVETGQALLRDDYVRWQKILFEKGWIAPSWPVEHGGTGWTPLQRFLFIEQLGLAPTPRIVPFGLVMVGPVIMAFGNDEQKRYYLPRILSSEDFWCQGYSEPNSGSDLASLETSAVADGDDYVVNGTKTWITFAQHANLIFCLVRTSREAKRQQGISFLLIDMHSPGITVRPIKTIDGGDDEIHEVFFRDVRVPRENLVGEEGQGWTYAKFLLQHERTGIGTIGHIKRELGRLEHIARQELTGGDKRLIDDELFRHKLAGLHVELIALESVILQVLADEVAGSPPGPVSSLLKIKGTELQQAVTELAFEAVGQYANPYGESVGPAYATTVGPRYFNWRKASIYAGSNEIQRSIIAKLVLGL